MTGILFVTICALIAGYAIWQYYMVPAMGKNFKPVKDMTMPVIVLAAALLARIICACLYKGHNTDMTCFTVWANNVFENGTRSFYTSAGFTDYPPGYMYILYVVGAIKHLFSIDGNGYYLLVKLPAILADLACGYMIYMIASKKLSESVSAVLCAAYVFNPAVITDSSLWGQVDSVYTFFIVLMVWLIFEKRLAYSYFVFAVCILIKPHSFIYTPLIVYGIIENYVYPRLKTRELIQTIAIGIGAIAFMVVLTIPFGTKAVFDQYIHTLSEYPNFTINAFNIWGALGLNWDKLTTIWAIAGYVILAVIVAASAVIFFKSRNGSKYFYTAAFLAFATFMLSTKMHERYGFPVMIFLLLAVIEAKNVHNFALYVLVSASQFFNIAWVLFIYEQDINKYAYSPVINAASVINILIFAYMLYVTYKLYILNETAVTMTNKASKPAQKKTAAASRPFRFKKTAVLAKITRADLIIMLVIMAVYSAVALYDLGDMHAPQTGVMLSNSEISVDFGRDTDIGSMKFFLGVKELNDSDRKLDIKCYDANNNETYSDSISSGSVFYWNEKSIDAHAKRVVLSTTADSLYLNELSFKSQNGGYLTPASLSGTDAELLFDEQKLVPERPNFRNGTYFDEIYHARTAYEFIHHLPVYEWTHPPLGKIFISIGIRLFGMTPFGWRIAGTVFGIFMIPIIYIFAKKLLSKRYLAVVTCLLFTFDFMHFAQTRIATIDVYVTFFIMLMYLFMFKYYSMSFYDTPLKKTLAPLAFCGIAMGLGIASKWTGMYAGAGLAVIFFFTLYRRYREYRHALLNPRGETDGISHKYVIETFADSTVKTLAWCIIFFIVVPALIYGLSYIPYLLVPDSEGIKTIFENQRSMLTYHGSTVLDSTHPYSSRWYEWIIMKRPIWYYSGTVSDGIKEGISSFGNPLVWWFVIPSFFLLVYTAFDKKDKTALFLIIAYLAQLVPWMGVERLTFIYHYFPCVPFITLMIGYSIKQFYDAARHKTAVRNAAFVYTGLVIVLFIMFYPVLAGQPCSVSFAENFLKWFNSWVLL